MAVMSNPVHSCRFTGPDYRVKGEEQDTDPSPFRPTLGDVPAEAASQQIGVLIFFLPGCGAAARLRPLRSAASFASSRGRSHPSSQSSALQALHAAGRRNSGLELVACRLPFPDVRRDFRALARRPAT